MIITCSICGKQLSLEEINDSLLYNEVMVKLCNMVRKRVNQTNCA